MTLVLKSNNTAVNAISDKHGLLAATDWKLMLDFENSDFVLRNGSVKTAVDVNSYLEASNGNAFIYDKSNAFKTLPANSLRMSLNPRKDAYGLCSESGFTELYIPVNNPISKKINLTAGPLVGPYLVRMKGSGSVNLSGTYLTNVTGTTVTENQPVTLYSNGGASTPTLDLAIVGEVTHLSVIAVGLANSVNINNNVIAQNTTTWWFQSGINKLKTDKVAELLGQKTDFTVLIQCVDNDYLNVPGASSGIQKPLFELVGPSGNHMSVIKRKVKPTELEELAVRLYDGSAETIVTMSGVKRTGVVALTSGSQGVKIAMDGKVTNPSSILSGFLVSDILVGSSNQWYTSGNRKAEGVITKLVIYDRQLTNDELAKATLSFQ